MLRNCGSSTAGMNEQQCRHIVYERAERLCERCCRNGSLSVHHRKKRSQGGLWTPDNCVLLCGHGTKGCHGWVEHNPTFAHAEGWHVKGWQSPWEMPLFWRLSRWVLLRMTDGELVDAF